ncbi:MAG: hypothetical protein IPM33_10210 [Phycisphaerales bacterium]|nr:hypothetical protein [Phycisphaerales bacterium]
MTAWGIISAINAPNEVLFAMSIRGLLESAANLAHLRANLQRTYAGDLPRKDMSYLALRMKFATRKPDDAGYESDEAARVSSVNVLTTIKALDKFATTDLGFSGDKTMTTWYERLSEFCHPNCLGNSVGSELDFPSGIETYRVDPGIHAAVLGQFSQYAYVLLYASCLLWNDCWRMMSNAEEVLPTFEPTGTLMILLD